MATLIVTPSDNDLPSAALHKHAHPTIMCCKAVKPKHYPKTQEHLDLLTFAKKLGATTPFTVVTAPMKLYGNPWTDYPIVIGTVCFSYADPVACQVSWYGVGDFDRGKVVKMDFEETLPVVSRMDAVTMDDECLVRADGGLDLGCKRHARGYTVFLVQFQHAGERERHAEGARKEEERLNFFRLTLSELQQLGYSIERLAGDGHLV